MTEGERPAELLDGDAARAYITGHLEQMTEKDMCAVFMIDLDHTVEIVGMLGQKGKDRIIQQTEEILSMLFKASDLVSRVGNDEFLIFCAGKITEEEARKKAENICSHIQSDCKDESGIQVTACTGAYLTGGEGIAFDKLFGQAAAALFEAKERGRGSSFVLTDQDIKSTRPAKKVSGISIDTILAYMDEGVSLIEVGPKLQIIYANPGFYQMLGIGEGSLSLPCELTKIGIHPDYETDYEQLIREGVRKEGFSEHFHRISRNGKDWVWRHVRVVKTAYPGRKYPVMLELSTDISELIQTERRLRESNERLRVAFGQTPHSLWEVDLEERTFNVYNVNEQCCQRNLEVRDFPGSFLKKGIVHPDSAEDFRMFTEKLLKGKAAGSGNFVILDRVGKVYGWVSMSYRMIYDEEGKPVKAIGVQSKLPGLSGTRGGFMRRRAIPEIMRRYLLVRMKVNLTRNAVEEIWIDGADQTAWTWGRTYSDIIELEKKKLFIQNSAREFGERFQWEHLLELYEKRIRWSTKEFQRVDEAGNIGWITDTVNLVKDSESGDIYMYACTSDSGLRHKWEGMINGTAEKDPDTGIYTVQTVRKIFEALSGRGSKTECALSLIRMLGEEQNEELHRFAAVAFSMAMGIDSIIGQYKPDTLLAIIPNAGSRFDVKRRIEDACAYFRNAMYGDPEMENLRFVAGTVTESMETADYDSLLIRAGYLNERGKNLAMDTVVFPSEEEDWSWMTLQQADEEGTVVVESEEVERPLTKNEQAAAFHCIADMLSAKSLENSLTDVLRGIGRFYSAARTYILEITEDKKSVDMTYEWVGSGKQSIRHVMRGVRLTRVPILKNCLEEGAPVCMESSASVFPGKSQGKPWRFTAFPLQQEHRITGFLCVENAQTHVKDLALLGTLAPYIMGEEKRFYNMTERALEKGQDSLTKLPNLSSYMDVIYSLDSDAYTSMGALALDIPNYSVINSSYGFEYGRKMLLYIAETLTGVFGNAYIFRTWDAEFVVLFPNTIQEVFTGRCTRLRTMIQRRYPRQVRIGYVWAEGVFSARNMVKEARTIMRSENVREPFPDRSELMEGHSPEQISKKSFVPYFQPKVDMRTGALTGAEALARKIGENGEIMLPRTFIEPLEESGRIRELDLCMVEMVLQQLSTWKAEGLPPVCVSINISRVTLFNPTTLASILALQSRYPEIPPDQIKLEITETAGDMEKASLAEVVDTFRQCGIQFELDDFGTGYANISVFSNIKFCAVKLDRSLVHDLPDNEISSMMVENLTQICQNIDMKCIAEGVETKRQAEALIKAGCVYGQGFYFAAPMSAHEFEKRYLKNVAKEEVDAIDRSK